MKKTSLFNIAKPYLAICIALILTIFLYVINTFLVIELEFHWLMVLWLSLIASLMTILMQVVSRERSIKSYSDQMLVSKERLANEIKHRLWAEKTASESKVKSLFIDENIPIMLAYFNTDLRCRYHNRIFRRWFGLKPDQIDGRLLMEFSDAEFYSSIKDCIEEIQAGKTIHNERILNSTKGFPYIFTEQYIPHLDNKGKTIGFYTLHTPRAQEKEQTIPKTKAKKQTKPVSLTVSEFSVKSNTDSQSNLISKSSTTTATRIAQAIKEGEFNLYYQKINSIQPTATASSHYEILIRMNEEENNLMPPGSFLPLVDQYKMMPQLDRWIVNYIVQWLSAHPEVKATFCLNVARDTLNDRAFPSFIQECLQKVNVPASSFCFEVEVLDARTNIADTLIFTQEVRELGCLVSLCSFDPDSSQLLDKIEFDYLKIDGSLVCNILRDEEDLEKIITINQLAHKTGIQTIAELVETDDILAKLQQVGVDYAQGFGIGKAQPFKDLEL
ncbi:MAG: EAL domain-containing protein [Nitrosomonas sp.]|nr:EAL domain-containing protein [Nitrosomonas sp.]